MKKILFLFLGLILACSHSYAEEIQEVEVSRITYVDGSGYSSGFCRSNDYFCPKDLHDRSESDGKYQAQTRCYLNHGTPLQYTATCNTYCSPAYIPPNSNTYVTCNSNCRMQCEVKDN